MNQGVFKTAKFLTKTTLLVDHSPTQTIDQAIFRIHFCLEDLLLEM